MTRSILTSVLTAARISCRLVFLILIVYLGAFVALDHFGPSPNLPCDVLLLGSVTSSSAVVLVKSCTRSNPLILNNDETFEADIRFEEGSFQGFLGSYEFKNLLPDTVYKVTYKNNRISFRTFPATAEKPQDPFEIVNLTFGSCSSVTSFPWSSLDSAYSKMLSLNPRFSLFLGDNVYVDVHEALPWYRIPFETAHLRVISQPAVQRFMTRIPSFAMFDDHEVENDFSNGLSHPHAKDGLQAYLKYWGQRNPGRPMNLSKLYYNFDYGQIASFFVLETRLNYDPTKGHLLGDEQMNDLLAWIERSAKRNVGHIIIASPISWSADGHGETFLNDREKVFSAIAQLNLCNVIILSGDMHFGAAYSHAFGRVLELSASPFQAFPFWPDPDPHNDEKRGYRRIFIHGGLNFYFGALQLSHTGGRFDVYAWPTLLPQSQPRIIETFEFNRNHCGV